MLLPSAHVLGAGSVGLLWAYHLRAAGVHVTLLLRNQAEVTAFKRQGSRVHLKNAYDSSAEGSFCASEPMDALTLYPDRGTPAVAPIEQLILATKALDCLPALRTALPHLAPASRCVLLQNGMPALMRQLQHELGLQLGLPSPYRVPPSALSTVTDPSPGSSTTTATCSRSASDSCHVPPRTYVGSVMHGCYVQSGVVEQSTSSWSTAEARLAGEEGLPSFAVVHAAMGGVSMGPLPPLLAASERLRARQQQQRNHQGSDANTTITHSPTSSGSISGTGLHRGSCVSGGTRGSGAGQVAMAGVSSAPRGGTDGGNKDDDGAYLQGLSRHLPGLRIRRVAEPDALLRELYTKMAANCIVNPITALLGCRNGQLLEQPRALRLMQDMCGELVDVYGTEAFAPPPSTQPEGPGSGAGGSSGVAGAEVVEALYQRVLAGVRVTARHQTSMLQDVLACRPTEVDYLVGHVAACAEERGVDAPVHRTLAGLVGTKQEMYLAGGHKG